jgi:hypothetical protein
MSGRLGWGADCHVRELEGGERVARGRRVLGRVSCGVDIFRSDARPLDQRGGWAIETSVERSLAGDVEPLETENEASDVNAREVVW